MSDDSDGLQKLEERFQAYVEKALREAKLRTNWSDGNVAYETAVRDYVGQMLSPDNQDFLGDFVATIRPVLRAGHVNSLSQTLIKLMAPGVPDIYQGSEAKDLSLVDPDNRREPDFKMLQRQLSENEALSSSEEGEWQNGWLKQNVTAHLLHLRTRLPDLFRTGEYLPLEVSGKRQDNIIAFARHDQQHAVLVIAPRMVLEALHDTSRTRPSEWTETQIALPQPLSGRRYRDLFSGRSFDLRDHTAVNWLFADHPFSVLVAE
jgi:(1->4)-alpha-D-glucan 1-alpha-D-glucosylmutase